MQRVEFWVVMNGSRLGANDMSDDYSFHPRAYSFLPSHPSVDELAEFGQNDLQNSEWSAVFPSCVDRQHFVLMALLAPGSLHDWLTKSSYVWGRDQTGAVVGRKKCRAHRKGANHGDGQGVTPDRDGREGLGKVSNRRYRRWLNDRLLRELVPPLEAAEIESLFAPPPWGEKHAISPLERVTGRGENPMKDAAGWEPYRLIDMDLQAKLLEQGAQSTGSMKGATSKGKQPSAMEAWRGVERTAREVLRRNSQSPLLQLFEEKLLAYLSEVEEREDGKELVLEVEAPFHRLLLHGLSQFHGLVSRTEAVAHVTGVVRNDASRCRTVIHIKKGKTSSSCSADRSLNLTEFLRDVQHHQVAAVS